MRIISAGLAGAVVFLLLSCTSAEPANKYPNMVANVDPTSVGSIDAQFDRLFSARLNFTEIGVVFHPRLNAVALEFRYEMIRYRQFWDESARKQFVQSLERYKADYEARNLVNRYQRTDDIYGKTRGRLEWVTFRLARTRVSRPSIVMGYRFRMNSPYFAILMRSAKEQDVPNGESVSESPQIIMYLTRAQAEELAHKFDQAFLMAYIGGQNRPETAQGPMTDDYLSPLRDGSSELEDQQIIDSTEQ